MPLLTNGAPGFGIGETLKAGLKLIIAQKRIIVAIIVRTDVRV